MLEGDNGLENLGASQPLLSLSALLSLKKDQIKNATKQQVFNNIVKGFVKGF